MNADWRTSVNLGPNHGIWRPHTWQDIVDAASGGLLDESPWIDLKSELKPGRPGNNDLAVDAAAMSLEGGTLIYGVEDHNSHAGKVVGVELAGLADRVDQVVRAKIHPPVIVRSIEIDDLARPGWGCLLVIVPPSPQAPHMVDNVYYGRSDRANRKLTDQDVRQELARRAQLHLEVAGQLQLLRKEDPIAKLDGQGHLYVIAQPLAARDDALADFLTGPTVQERVFLAANEITQRLGRKWAPTLTAATRVQRRADGVAFTSLHDPERIRENGLVELVVREDGGLALTCGRGTDTLNRGYADQPGMRVTFPVLVLGLTHSVLAMAARLAVDVSGYQGQWSIGVLLDRMKGVIGYDPMSVWYDLATPYSRAEYDNQTTTTTAEMTDDAPAVVQRLLGKLIRGLGVEARYLPYSVDSLLKAPD